MHTTLLSGLLSGAVLLAADAGAQTAATAPAPAAPPAAPVRAATPGAPATPVVSVTAERPTNRIDRQVYDVRSDISSSNGTAADALNNVPSVAVDPDGSVTLRGSSNVQILVDGKPSAMFQGENRGAALNAMAADDIESVEVINNPGAQFGNEAGGGPILNLVLRRNRKPGGFGTVSANAGTAGRYNSAASGSYNEGPWAFQGGVNLRHDGRNATGDVSRERIDPASGALARSSQSSRSQGLNDAVGLNGTVSYNLDASDTLTASAAFNGRGNDQRTRERYINGRADGSLLSDYLRTTEREGNNRGYSWGARYDHKGALPGETLKIDLRVSNSDNSSDSRYDNVYTVFAPNAFDRRSMQHNVNDTRIVDFSGDYERPLGGGTARLGYKVASNRAGIDALYTDIDPVTQAGSVNALRSNAYALDEQTVALYGSWQTRINERWGAQAGLRTEYTDLDLHQYTSGVTAKNSYINFMPSFFATYKAGENATVRLAYAHRLRRPSAADLNPYVLYRDDFNVFSGNPKLKPTQTDSVELGVETRVAGLDTNLRGYFRRDTDAIVDTRYFLSDNVLLTTRDNGAGSHAGGLEFTVSGKLSPSWTINTSGNLARTQQRLQDIDGTTTTRTANSLSGRARLNYQYAPASQVQLALQMMGKTLSGQGYRAPNATLNASLRHALTPRLSLVANVTDLFNTNRIETVVDSAVLRETSTRRFDGRVFYLGLSYRIGGVDAAPDSGTRERRYGPGRGRGDGQRPGPGAEPDGA